MMFLLRGVWKYLAVALGAVVAVLAFAAKMKREGRAEEKAKQTEKIHEKVEKSERVRRTARDPGERKRVRKFYRD